ncbi:MAG: tRNA (guanosine(46)-N7)-methyltransferase TrmB [Rhodospirillaceae bacterium]|jgi:tRNA (guanine-N7-)-methyltransferase|nr:tRNA (guanosine(46)-N7)-methyltransferase TrmB [Rhodospirillaceae bacterium]
MCIDLRFFGRRRGRPLHIKNKILIDTLLPKLSIKEPKLNQYLDPWALFASNTRELWLEIGFGSGEHLAWQAGANPDIGFIGCEIFLNGIASLLSYIDRQNLKNIRIFANDVRHLFLIMPPTSLYRVFLLFPDPWPKRRHIKRRFICHDNLDQLSLLMVDGAELRIATDDNIAKAWITNQMKNYKNFQNITENPLVKSEDWPITRYEIKAQEQCRQSIFLRYQHYIEN